MNSKDKTAVKPLPIEQDNASDRERTPVEAPRSIRTFNVLIALVTAALLALVLLPGTPRLGIGDTAPRTVIAPYSLHLEYPGPDQTTVSFTVTKGEVIIAAGSLVTERSFRVLEAIERRDGIGNRFQAFLGLCILVLVFFYLFYRDVKRYRPALISDRKKILLLASLLLMTVVIAQFSKFVLQPVAERLQLDIMTVGFAIPAAAGAMMVSMMLDFHMALGFSFVVSILLGILLPGDPFIPLYYFVGSIVAALRVIRCKKRSAVIRAGAWIGVVNLIAVVGIDLYRGELWTRGPYDLAAGLSGALLVSMIVSVSLPIFESLFDIATDIKLLELLDPNHPLLKDLVCKSPGTYHHSIVIGNLAEAAAEAIGENAILARVSAYYHDIGKSQKPEYFIENQRSSENKHDRLAPSMSSLILVSHVKEGVEMARTHRLPSAVVDIMQQHHGTALITYFYQKAKELQPRVAIAEEDYRYPGPRPRTKVAAIVMLSDAVEAASRTLESPTPQQIQALTSSVITRFFIDNQLSMCDLTLKDLREIARSFNLSLSGIFHHRIDYPGIEFPGEKRHSEHQDKKQPEEKKTVDAAHKEPAAGAVADGRPS